MALNIEFTPRPRAWIETEAERRGVPPDEVVRRLVDQEPKELKRNVNASRAAQSFLQPGREACRSGPR
jgi:hypothetical protein